MTRYIDADALIEAMTKFSNATGEDMTHGIFYAHIAPTIDAVPINWLIRMRNKHKNDGFAWIYEAVIEDWRKEHDKTD